MASFTIKETLMRYDKRYYQYKINNIKYQKFKSNFFNYIKKTNEAIAQNESEEHLKNITNKFLGTIYHGEKYEINTSGRTDSSIREDGNLRVLIENKKPSNKGEMIAENNINVKALHEILFYYMVETRNTNGVKVKRRPDVEIRRCIITDTDKWVIIDANEIEKIVDGYLEKHFYKYQNKQLSYSNNTLKFYKDTENYLKSILIDVKMSYLYFEMSRIRSDRDIMLLYKALNKPYLLKKITNYGESSHVLNDKFYQELLYLMGLKEVSNKGNKTIQIDHSVKNTLADQVYNILKNDKEYNEIDCIEKTFELVIIWMNRLLFIKLFEGQLIAFNEDAPEYHILDDEKITNFQELQNLFFGVLGTKDREESIFYDKFKSIPYLNSSLFERYDAERNEVNINMLHNYPVTIKKKSNVGTKAQTESPILNYIIAFLNNYSFSSEVGKNNTIVKGRDIIDSSVLGLIFEKLNGYRDGSFYTPSHITEYMCEKSIEGTIIDLINKRKLWDCNNLLEIKSRIGYSLSAAKEINDIINEVKICDISVGSGHFLVSALNRIITIKRQLGVLFKHEGDELLTEYDIDVVDDTLKIFDGQGYIFSYDKTNVLSQQVQETIFNEKKVIIENCLFGVDLNSKAVAICQLRLWIELLKNAYYKHGVMETLPNIDINIKSGNSLVNRLPFEVGDRFDKLSFTLEKDTKKQIKKYKELVAKYKETSDKSVKADILTQIKQIKSHLHQGSQITFNFDDDAKDKYNYGIDPKLYKGAFEWLIEFPELLNDNGVFQGFDCIIGNPPYGLINKRQNQNISISVIPEVYKYYNESKEYSWAKGHGINIYRMFICRCFSLLKSNGYCCLIFPMSFLCDITNSGIRRFVVETSIIDMIEVFPEKDLENKRVFKDAKVPVCILGARNTRSDSSYKFRVRIHKDKYVDKNNAYTLMSYDDMKSIDSNNIPIPLIHEHEMTIYMKMMQDSIHMSEYSKCYTGEVDKTLDKQYITNSDKYNPMLVGAQVQKYYLTNNVSQGEILYLKEAGYLEKHKGESSRHHEKRRIVMQAMNGVNEQWRLKMSIAHSPYYCANSVNYLLIDTEDDLDYVFLGILNSKLLNWCFQKTSTNNNINGYQVDALPIKLGNKKQQDRIKSLVSDIINSGEADDVKMQEINDIVYQIYGITEYEIPFIEK